MKILVVEDNPQVAETIMDYLELAGHRLDCAYHGQAALQLLEEQRFDVIIMDVMMPRLDGLSTVARLREQGIATPVLFLTARDSLEDKLAGFKAGGDDYLVKPFAMEELEVRLQALSLRGPRGDVGAISFGDLTVDVASGRATRAGGPLKLGKIPFQVLALLARRALGPPGCRPRHHPRRRRAGRPHGAGHSGGRGRMGVGPGAGPDRHQRSPAALPGPEPAH